MSSRPSLAGRRTPRARRSSLRALALVCGACCALGLANGAAAEPCDVLGKNCPTPLHPDTARGVGLGTGVRASAVSTSALAYNPAALVLGKLYHIEGSVDYLPEFNTVALGGAVVDSATSRVGAGVAFRGFLSGDEGIGGIDGRLAIAFPFAENVSIGLGGRYVHLEYTDQLPAELSLEAELVSGFTMDASLRVAPTQGLSFAIVAANFIDLESAYAPVILGGAGAFTFAEIVTLGLDVLLDLSSFESAAVTAGGGLEVLISQTVPLRIGYAFDVERELHTLSGGAGYTDRSVGFDLSFAQQVAGGDDTRIMGAFRYYVH